MNAHQRRKTQRANVRLHRTLLEHFPYGSMVRVTTTNEYGLARGGDVYGPDRMTILVEFPATTRERRKRVVEVDSKLLVKV